MPRSARKESGCGIYHVMMRGVNRQVIFDDDEDCRRFMDILADLPFQHDDDGRLLPIRTCVIYAWCLMMNQGGIIMLRLQKDKTHEYEVGYKMLKQKEQPSCMIIIDNRFEQQRILIERSKDVFAPATIARMMETTIGKWMTQKYRVGLRMPLVYKKDQFWNVIEEFKNCVKKLIFNFPYPNMARPMDKLGASLKKFGVDLKGKVRIIATSQPRDFLVIDPKEKNEDLDEIVSYLYEVGSPVDIYLVNGKRVKCFSKENPTVIQVPDKIANFRGEDDGNLFQDSFWETVAEKLNELKRINYDRD